jgi:integrase
MPIWNRNEDYPDREPNWWLDYYVTKELAAEHGLKRPRVREPGCGANKRASQRMLEQREREVERGTWQPREREGMTVEQWCERHFHVRLAAAELAKSPRAPQNVGDEKKRIEAYVLPRIGKRAITSITTADIKGIVAELVREGRLSVRTVLHVYSDTRTMFKAAAAGENPIIARNPCTLSSKGYDGGLPKKRDKDPTWRSKATFTHAELRQLFTDERLPIDRRMLYALIFFCGNRFGEAAGRRLRDYDRDAQPLGRILCASQYDDQPLKGEAPARDIPVHPFLAWMLEQWFAEGFELVMGRPPTDEDWLVPSRLGALRSLSHTRKRLAEDLLRIGLRKRSPHALRAAFISLAQQDGGDRTVLEVVTHKGNRDVWGGYTRHPWPVLCEHVARLKMDPPAPEPRSHLWSHEEKRPRKYAKPLEKVGRGDWIRSRGPGGASVGNPGLFVSAAVERYAESAGIPTDGTLAATSRVAEEWSADLALAADMAQSGRALTAEQRRRVAVAAAEASREKAELAAELAAAAREKGRSA